jgi:hypothetical protein
MQREENGQLLISKYFPGVWHSSFDVHTAPTLPSKAEEEETEEPWERKDPLLLRETEDDTAGTEAGSGRAVCFCAQLARIRTQNIANGRWCFIK